MPNRHAFKRRSFRERISRYVKLGYLKILRIDDSPEKIARGAALGAFIGLMPTLGVGLILCVIFSFIFRLNKAATIIGSFAMNPFTAPLVWSFSITVGNYVFFWQDAASTVFYGVSREEFFRQIGHIPLIFVTGNTVIASFFSIIIYFIVKKGVIRRRAKKELRRLKRESMMNRGSNLPNTAHPQAIHKDQGA